MNRRRFSNPFPSSGSKTSSLAPPYRPRTYSHNAGDYQQEQHLASLRCLREDFRTSADTISTAALHRHSARSKREVVALADATRDYDQQHLLLDFLLRARPVVAFRSADFAAIEASLRLAGEALAGAGWRVLRYADLCSVCVRRRASGRMVWNTELGGVVDVGRLRAQLSAQRFWTNIARDLRNLGEVIGQEANWLATFVGRNDGGNPHRTFDGDSDCMFGALKTKGEPPKRRTWPWVRKPLEISGMEDHYSIGNVRPRGTLAHKAQYQWLKAYLKLRGNHPAEERMVWSSIYTYLDNLSRASPPGLWLLKVKVETKRISAERRVQNTRV